MFRLTELVLKAYADTIAESIVIRSYDKHGNSRDYRRDTTDPEKKIISTIIYGGLLAIRSGADKQSVKDACEYIGKLQIPEMNGRDTIYDPIDNYPERPIRAERKSDMKKYNLIETNHGDSKILTTGTLSEILNYLQDNPRIYEWMQDEIIGDPAMTAEQKAEEIAGLQIDLTDIDSVDDLQRQLDKVNLTWWDLKVEEVMVKFEILWDYVNVRKLNQMVEGATLDLSDGDSTDPELIKAFRTKEEALKELGKYHSSYKKLSDSTGALYRFEEYRVEENHYNAEGELTNYIGVWGYSKYKPSLIGRFEGENDYFIDGYKVVNEPAEKELYIYKFDPDSENYEHYDIMPMPDFWEDYIFNASKNNPIIEEAFENEIKNYLSL